MHVCDSYMLNQGDIEISQIETNQKRNAVKDKKKLWDFEVVPYEIDTTAGFDNIKIAKIKAAIKYWKMELNMKISYDLRRQNVAMCDYLEVYDGYWNKSWLLGRFCGSSTTEIIKSTSNHATQTIVVLLQPMKLYLHCIEEFAICICNNLMYFQ